MPPVARPTKIPWPLLVALAVLPVVAHSIGAPLGEPVADDFDYLARALLERTGSFFDGYGAMLYWRPLGRQIYFGLLAPLIVDHRWLVPLLHALVLAATVLLIYRALHTRWPASWAAFGATFPLFAESTRMLIAWPSNFMDLGAMFFAGLALHEASRRRMATTLLALLASLLSKEVGVLAALLVPWMPGGDVARRERWRWAVASVVVVLAWGVAYFVISSRGDVTLPHRLEALQGAPAAPIGQRLVWAIAHSLRALFSLSPKGGPWDAAVIGAVAMIVALAAWRATGRPAARASLRRSLPWIAWGGLWFVLSSAPLAEVHPLWAPYRAVFGGIGLGIALAAALGAIDTRLLAALFVVRLAAFASSPGPPREVRHEPPDTGAFVDFGRLARLERLMADIRGTLASRFPTLPPGARVCHHLLPLQSEYALCGDKALQVWYRDTTLRWVRFDRFEKEPATALATLVQYQPESHPQIALVEPAAMRRLIAAGDAIRRRDPSGAMPELAAAESLQVDPHAKLFFAQIAAKRAVCLAALGADDQARREAERALALSSIMDDARFALGYVWLRRGNLPEVRRHLEYLEAELPGDPRVAQLAQLYAEAERGGR